jgi:hypothetical protein
MRHLEKLIEVTQPSDKYHQMAHDYLWQDNNYAELIAEVQQQSRTIPGMTRRRIALVLGIAVMVIAVMSALVRWASQQDESESVSTEVAALPTLAPTLLPDNSTRLNVNDHSQRYDGGLLLVAALEDHSQRVLDSITLQPLSPVAGARFYAIEIFFECRQGICNEPPQAKLSLALENDFVVAPREGAFIQNSEPLEPIALGRRTRGWIIFEVPTISQPVELIITPLDLQGRNNPVTIPLPAPD